MGGEDIEERKKREGMRKGAKEQREGVREIYNRKEERGERRVEWTKISEEREEVRRRVFLVSIKQLRGFGMADDRHLFQMSMAPIDLVCETSCDIHSFRLFL